MGDLFTDDDQLDQAAAEGCTTVQLVAYVAALSAEHDQAVSAKRDGQPHNLKSASRRLAALRSFTRARQVAEGVRTAGPVTITEGN